MVVLSMVCSCVSMNIQRDRRSISVPIKPSFEIKEAFNMGGVAAFSLITRNGE